jgi:hypothetical protein
MTRLSLSCREATALQLQQADRTLVWHERLSLRTHQFICLACRRFEVQARLMEQATAQWRRYRDEDETPPPDEDAAPRR